MQVLAPGGITWLRLDGGVEAGKRFGVVQQFNADPSIDVMLLTTAVTRSPARSTSNRHTTLVLGSERAPKHFMCASYCLLV